MFKSTSTQDTADYCSADDAAKQTVVTALWLLLLLNDLRLTLLNNSVLACITLRLTLLNYDAWLLLNLTVRPEAAAVA